MTETHLLAEPPFVREAAPGNSIIALAAYRSIASIAAFRDCSAALQDALGFQLPGPNRQMRHDGVLYLWAGLETWLAIADDPDFTIELTERCNGVAAVTDQSDGRSILQITGPAASGILAKLLPIDLHPNVFPADATAMTLAGHVSVQIWRSEDGFELACFRSFAETLYDALTEASRY